MSATTGAKKSTAAAAVTQQKPTNFYALLAAFEKIMQEAIVENKVDLLITSFNSFNENSEHDKRLPMEQAFRDVLMQRLNADIECIGVLVRLSVAAARAEIVSNTIPVVLLGDTFDVVTLDKCEQIFLFVEQLVEVWKEEIFFASCKNNILRMCNDLLRRLSRTQNTVFCGRILLFLSKFFPFSERSGLNIVSEFNLENFTEYGLDNKEVDDIDNKELEDTAEDIPLKIDYDLYCKFWSLQDFFRNPNQCYSKAQWKMFQMHAETILESFASFKLEDIRQNNSASGSGNANANDGGGNGDGGYEIMDMDTESVVNTVVASESNFFAKFLTNPKLLALQLSDSNFRRSVLVQFLILFQYLQVTVKFKTESYTLTPPQSDFIKDTESRVYKLLEETPPNGKRFSRTVQHMLTREEMWNNWKNDGCKEFKKPEEPENTESLDLSAPPPAKRKRSLGDCLREASRNGKFFMANDNLTKLWNYSPDNLQACKSEQRNFLPQLETYLELPHQKVDPAFEWRALRLLARQTPHFFTFVAQPSCKISDYLEVVRKRLIRERELAKQVSAGGDAATVSGSENGNGLVAITAPEAIESESVALQEPDTVQDLEVVETEVDTEPVVEDDNAPHEKTLMVTRAHIEEIAPLIGEPWMKLGKKIGFTNDELLFFQMENPAANVACIQMLSNWISDDDDATLDNWAYMLEGLDMNDAANAVKVIIDREKGTTTAAQSNDNNNTEADDVEILSD